jgi:hypothetical protein
MFSRRFILLPAVAAIASIPIDAPENLLAAPMPNFKVVAKSILVVSPENCAGRKAQNATAFVWKSSNTVVTTLHNLIGCQTVSVTSGEAGARTATITRMYKKADLALLTINGALLPVLPESSVTPDKDHPLWLLTPDHEHSSQIDKNPIVLNASRTLRNLVSNDVARQIESSAFPALDLNVFYSNALSPRSVGAPIIDATGAVVAMADGGLNGGIVALNWAVSTKYLADLLQSNENINDVSNPKNFPQFSFEEPSSGSTISCGATTFTRILLIDMVRAVLGTGNAAGLQKLANAFHIDNPDAALFDVYQDLASGAAVALPKGAQVTATPAKCTVSFPDTPITIEIETSHYKADNLDDAIKQRRQFELRTLSGTATGTWEPDYRWTIQPLPPRFDDFVSSREGWTRTLPGFPKPVENVFMACAIKRGTFLGIAARTPSSYALAADAQHCTAPSHGKNCPQLLQQMQNWGNAVIAVYLTTFSVG